MNVGWKERDKKYSIRAFENTDGAMYCSSWTKDTESQELPMAGLVLQWFCSLPSPHGEKEQPVVVALGQKMNDDVDPSEQKKSSGAPKVRKYSAFDYRESHFSFFGQVRLSRLFSFLRSLP